MKSKLSNSSKQSDILHVPAISYNLLSMSQNTELVAYLRQIANDYSGKQEKW